MNSKKDYKFVLLKGCLLLLGLAISAGLCTVLIPGIDKGEIITLSASSNQEKADISREQQAVNQSGSANAPANEPAPVIQKQNNSSVNAVTEAAVKLGILSCVSRVNQVAAFLTANNQAGVFIFKPQNQPDQHVFTTSFELIRNDESTLYASASFFPNRDAVYDTVEYVNANCDELEKTVFKNLKRIAVVKKNIIVLDGGAVKVFLMPAGSGTVVIKKEVVR